nr:SDR family oxidoreductase [uncultured Bacillus sp.]
MNNKIAVVTGALSGFGLLCVIELACAGFIVVATMRDVNKAEPLLKMGKEKNIAEQIHIRPLDVTSGKSIEQFETLLKAFPSVDVLVNNAGFACGGFCEELTVDDYRRQFETNFFGVIAVTQTVLPLMRANGRGRIINMSSISGKIGFPGLSAYVSSKHALEGYSESLRLEVKPFGIDVSLIEPGSYQTKIWSSMNRIKIKEGSAYISYMRNLMSKIETGKATHGDPRDVAKLVASIACQTAEPNLRYPIGNGVKRTLFLKATLPWRWLEAAILKKLNPQRD